MLRGERIGLLDGEREHGRPVDAGAFDLPGVGHVATDAGMSFEALGDLMRASAFKDDRDVTDEEILGHYATGGEPIGQHTMSYPGTLLEPMLPWRDMAHVGIAAFGLVFGVVLMRHRR